LSSISTSSIKAAFRELLVIGQDRTSYLSIARENPCGDCWGTSVSTRGAMLQKRATWMRCNSPHRCVVSSPAPPRNLRHAGMACEGARTCLSCCMWPTDDQSEVPHPFAPSLKHFSTSSCRETAPRGENFLCTRCCDAAAGLRQSPIAAKVLTPSRSHGCGG